MLDKRALQHNDHLPNENYHLNEAFQLLLTPGCNFLGDTRSPTFLLIRKTIIDMVLYTDMQRHFQAMTQFRLGRMSEAGLDVPTVLQLTLKCADLAHTTAIQHEHLLWVTRLEEEFFFQGDKEKARGMPVSTMMDREGAGISTTQPGFYEIVVLPMYTELVQAFPSALCMLQRAQDNHQYWVDMHSTS